MADRTLNCNGCVGCVPAVEAHGRLGCFYHTPEGKPVRRGANTFTLVSEAPGTIIDESVRSLEQLFGEPSQ